MSVTTVLDYKVNEADLKKWLESKFGSAAAGAGGQASFSYKVSLANTLRYCILNFTVLVLPYLTLLCFAVPYFSLIKIP